MAFDHFDHDDGGPGGLPRAVAFFLGFAFSIFVAGGFYSGWLFIANYQELANRGRITVAVPGAAPIVLQPRSDCQVQFRTSHGVGLLYLRFQPPQLSFQNGRGQNGSISRCSVLTSATTNLWRVAALTRSSY